MRILFVSNRLPIALDRTDGGWVPRAASGGLVTALVPLLKKWGGMWIGWPGVAGPEASGLEQVFEDFGKAQGYDITPVPLSTQEYERFYQGFCNEIVWPLFHDLQSRCNFDPSYWQSYQDVKLRFADVIQQHARLDDLIWIQDYHLMGVGKVLRDRAIHNKLAFFLHIPFPPPDIFCKLPWRLNVLNSLLRYDTIGFQTPRDLENFSDCVRKLLPSVVRRHSARRLELKFKGGSCLAGVFPIGIDFDEFADGAAAPSVAQRVAELRKTFSGQQIVLGLDRLDYTKGIPYRLRAFELALQKYPELHTKINFLQVVVPSRESVPEYQQLKAEIERLVAQINGRFTQPGWVPVHHVFRNVDRQEMLAYYQLADVALVTPLKDGMNLVSKEYVACQADGDGVLILSEFAGAAEQLGQGAVLVNPYDLDLVADAIRKAVTMTTAERQPNMHRMREILRRQDIHWWLDHFLRACGVRMRQAQAPKAPLPQVA